MNTLSLYVQHYQHRVVPALTVLVIKKIYIDFVHATVSHQERQVVWV